MASLSVRNVENETRDELRLRAARRGASMEDEARSILRAVVRAKISLDDLERLCPDVGTQSAWDSIRRLREKYGTFDLEQPARDDIAGERANVG